MPSHPGGPAPPRRRIALLAVVALAALAGCTITAPAGPTPGPATTTTADATTVGGGNGDATIENGSVDVTVTVTRVIDGDTVAVRFPNETEDTVRFVGVDAPETRGENAPGEFPGVPDTEAGRDCLREAGHAATRFVAERIEGATVGLRFDPDLERRGYYGRLLAYVVVDGETLNYALIERGHARVYESPFVERDRFEAAMDDAVEARRGLWACAGDTGDGDASGTGGSLRIVDVDADAPGNDNENLDEETVTFENAGDEPLDLSGWTVSDAAGHEYRFPEGATLGAGERVTLHTGSGTDSATDRYWGLDRAVWNNDGDTVTVRDATGTVVAERSY